MAAALLADGDALLVVDVQNDFVTGSLRVAGARAIIPVLGRYIAEFRRRQLPVVATRDWHPAGHCSFVAHGGRWPPHCIAGSTGAAFAAGLALGPDTLVVSKATRLDRDTYSGFEGTDLERRLRQLGVRRLFVGGLATEYCVLRTVEDALERRFRVVLLTDAIGAVNAAAGDGAAAERRMLAAGASALTFERLAAAEPAHG